MSEQYQNKLALMYMIFIFAIIICVFVLFTHITPVRNEIQHASSAHKIIFELPMPGTDTAIIFYNTDGLDTLYTFPDSLIFTPDITPPYEGDEGDESPEPEKLINL